MGIQHANDKLRVIWFIMYKSSSSWYDLRIVFQRVAVKIYKRKYKVLQRVAVKIYKRKYKVLQRVAVKI